MDASAHPPIRRSVDERDIDRLGFAVEDVPQIVASAVRNPNAYARVAMSSDAMTPARSDHDERRHARNIREDLRENLARHIETYTEDPELMQRDWERKSR